MGTLKAERVGRSLEGRVTAWTFAVHLPVMLKAWNGEVPTELETLELMYWYLSFSDLILTIRSGEMQAGRSRTVDGVPRISWSGSL